MNKDSNCHPVERLFPFVLRARCLFIGREMVRRSLSRLHFVLITEDLSESSRAEILSDFAAYPIVRHYTASELEGHFGIRGAKVIGFQKSGLAKSIYAQLKAYRINMPSQRKVFPTPLGEGGVTGKAAASTRGRQSLPPAEKP